MPSVESASVNRGFSSAWPGQNRSKKRAKDPFGPYKWERETAKARTTLKREKGKKGSAVCR